MKRLLLLSHKFYPFLGGIETMSEELAEYFSSLGYDVCVLTWTRSDINEEFPFQIYRNPSIFRILKEYMKSDIVLENNSNLQLSWPSFFKKRLKLLVLHGLIQEKNKTLDWRGRLKLKRIKSADKVVVVSHSLKKDVYEKAEVIHNFYRDNLFKEYVQLNDRGSFSFVFLGRIVKSKGLDIAVKTVERLSKETDFDNITLSIIGDGPMLTDIEELVENLKMKDKVFFLGKLEGEGLVKELNRHRYMLIPSWQESFGIVALEGIACGCLPFAYNIEGLPEAIGKAGIIVEENTECGFCEKIKYILNNPSVENELRANMSEHLQKYTKTYICNKYKIALESLYVL